MMAQRTGLALEARSSDWLSSKCLDSVRLRVEENGHWRSSGQMPFFLKAADYSAFTNGINLCSFPKGKD